MLPEGTFDTIVTGDSVNQGKPHPEPYLQAAAALGVDPAATLAIEDSDTGELPRRRPGARSWWSSTTCRSSRGSGAYFAETLVGLGVDDLPLPGATAHR